MLLTRLNLVLPCYFVNSLPRHSSLNQDILDKFDERGTEIVNMIVEEGSSPIQHDTGITRSAGLPGNSSYCSLERPAKQQKRHHSMVDTSLGYISPLKSMKQVSDEQEQYHIPSSGIMQGQQGFYPEHHPSYCSDDPQNGSYHTPTDAYNTNDNMHYPYWQQQQNTQSTYFNDGAQHMNPQDMSVMQQQSSYYYQQQSDFTSYPMGDYDHQAMNYSNNSNEQQSIGLVTADSAGKSITSNRRNDGWNSSHNNEHNDQQQNLDDNIFNGHQL